MSNPGEDPQAAPSTSYGEIAPGVPRYGQYAPEGYQPPPVQSGPVPLSQLVPADKRLPVDGDPQLPPLQVRIAFRLVLVAGAINTVLTVLGVALVMTPAGRSTVIDMMAQAGYNDLSVVDPAMAIAAGIGVVSIALYAIVAFGLRRGRRWARVLGTVLAAISLLSLVSPNIIVLIQVALGVAAMVLVYRQPAAGYFARR